MLSEAKLRELADLYRTVNQKLHEVRLKEQSVQESFDQLVNMKAERERQDLELRIANDDVLGRRQSIQVENDKLLRRKLGLVGDCAALQRKIEDMKVVQNPELIFSLLGDGK